jgi:hypothetical protein
MMNMMLQDLLRSSGLARVRAEIERASLPSIRLEAQAVDEIQLVRQRSKTASIALRSSTQGRCDGTPTDAVFLAARRVSLWPTIHPGFANIAWLLEDSSLLFNLLKKYHHLLSFC